MTDSSCSHEARHHHHHNHDHDDSKPDQGTQDFLYSKIALDQLVGYNLHPNHPVKHSIKPWDQRAELDRFTQSDLDQQIIIHIPFTGSVKLRTVIIRTLPGQFRLTHAHLLDFLWALLTPLSILVVDFHQSIRSDDQLVSQPTQSWLWYLRILKGYSSLGDPRDERDRRIPGPGGQILIRHLPLDLLHLNPSELKPRRSSRSPISDLFLRFQGRILNRFTQTDHCGLRSSSESQRSSKDFRYGRFDRSNDLRCQEISL